MRLLRARRRVVTVTATVVTEDELASRTRIHAAQRRQDARWLHALRRQDHQPTAMDRLDPWPSSPGIQVQ